MFFKIQLKTLRYFARTVLSHGNREQHNNLWAILFTGGASDRRKQENHACFALR